ncbi:FIST N-terminal domain-containing protein [Amaricoccus sp.]|uniref:FIST N-terminal domain-containing protein n=1 Tax=Amaricoccus sp. TaxID=1872485 RepID=UPI001B4F9190|nr:FIST N-terminal domain-containing protein [Amaricoccus sp.]MBP7000886.1 FIST C-terminal domain-containing protein [Amaricoccus sp.]
MDRGVLTAHAPVADAAGALADLAARGAEGGLALVAIFVAPEADLPRLAGEAAAAFPGVPVIGCTTAGEISPNGYASGEVVAIGFAATHFAARVELIGDLRGFDAGRVGDRALAMRGELAAERPDWTWEIAWLLNDGLAQREDLLVAALRYSLGTVPLFGGSAGDGLDFRRTAVLAGGAAHENAAVLAVLRSRCPARVFKFDHFRPTRATMRVTRADAARRIVHEIDGRPAAAEYARRIGREIGELTPHVFAAHPVLVTAPGGHGVRAIQKVEPDGALSFYAAIEVGLTLTLAEPTDICAHLARSLDRLAHPVRPAAIIGCDCILRRLEVEQKGARAEMSRVLSERGVVGFNTYGEQFNSVHVNQTFTGVAIYPPEDGLD